MSSERGAASAIVRTPYSPSTELHRPKTMCQSGTSWSKEGQCQLIDMIGLIAGLTYSMLIVPRAYAKFCDILLHRGDVDVHVSSERHFPRGFRRPMGKCSTYVEPEKFPDNWTDLRI